MLLENLAKHIRNFSKGSCSVPTKTQKINEIIVSPGRRRPSYMGLVGTPDKTK
jgi:hypothetical protein